MIGTITRKKEPIIHHALNPAMNTPSSIRSSLAGKPKSALNLTYSSHLNTNSSGKRQSNLVESTIMKVKHRATVDLYSDPTKEGVDNDGDILIVDDEYHYNYNR